MDICLNLVDAAVDPVAWARAREAEGWPVLFASDPAGDGDGAPTHHVVVRDGRLTDDRDSMDPAP